MGLLFVVSGCALRQSLGEPIDDPARRTALLGTYRRPEVAEAVFRTLIRWGGREISLTEIVKPSPDGSLSVAGITDIGSTLYAAQIDPDSHGQILSKSLPFSDRWLLEGLIAELLIPWNGPPETSQLYERSDGTWAMACKKRRATHLFIFNEAGTWQYFHRLTGSRVLSRAVLEWDGDPVPRIMRIDNPGRHYHAIRERVEIAR